ncbi:uncharacterized protein FA14DRAFT_160976 [Meira miltonrushii]|uniref:Uncharacterized protein n=1 Tax=Meira miltonrushii TaxID=1280837 RepID=A0A316VFK2_9BASI|nr:uncharacterized protein FA14DRAFT_160976 [Meira miltonrushii]PWN36104.1 hypothetical protein FA14DRAFT_160976 [Meira miltonrushii]
MATFQISHTPASSQFSSNNGASTSYLHLSGHGQSSKSRADQDGDQQMFETEEDGEMDEDMMGESESSTRLATAGQAIASSVTFMRGHGAYLSSASVSDGAAPLIRSSLCGVVRKTNKLISVNSLKTRYAPEVGDLVVGRITDLQPGNRRWRVDVRSRQEANLLLSSINLPGGIQRRKLESDELEMRNYFKEGDLLVCEVQSLFHDGSTSLHTRSLNYGKLRNGQLAIVNPCLIRRLKSHFVRLEELGLEIIIGLNGVLWISMLDTGKVNITTGTGRDIEAIYSDANDIVSNSVRRRIGRMLEIVAILSHNHRPISDVALIRGYEASVGLAPLDEGESNEMEKPQNALTADICRAILDHIDESAD